MSSSWVNFVLPLIPSSVLLGLSIWLFLWPSSFRRLLSRTRESILYTGESNGLRTRPVPRFALPYVAIAWVLLLAAGVMFAPMIHQDAEVVLTEYRDLTIFLMAPFLIGALVIHLRPNHSRELKYSLVLIPGGWELFFAGASVRQKLPASWAEAGPQLVIIAIMLPVLFWWSSIFLAEMLLLPRLLRRWDTSSRQFPRLYVQIFSILRMRTFGIVILVGLLVAPTIATMLLGARYILIEVFRRHPILYLRSFHQEEAPAVFGRAIAPALTSFGVIEALVHRTQTGSSLLSQASIWQFGLFATVSDADWQSWVNDGISRCSLIVIDCSVRTESVDWELQLARREMPSNRVLGITNDAISSNVAEGLRVSSYSTDRKGIKRLRNEVIAWAGTVLKYDPRKPQRVGVIVFVLLIYLPVLIYVLATTLHK
jgi:hypothetical protein